ncbi:hypothetical protein ACU4GD_31410, partial [Cupriavidus basilensis]
RRARALGYRLPAVPLSSVHGSCAVRSGATRTGNKARSGLPPRLATRQSRSGYFPPRFPPDHSARHGYQTHHTLGHLLLDGPRAALRQLAARQRSPVDVLPERDAAGSGNGVAGGGASAPQGDVPKANATAGAAAGVPVSAPEAAAQPSGEKIVEHRRDAPRSTPPAASSRAWNC